MKAIARCLDRFALSTLVIVGAALGQSTQAADISLADFGILRDGVFTTDIPTGGGFDPATGLGSIVMWFGTPGSHQGLLFVDHEFSENLNTFFNELGSVQGTAPGGCRGRSTSQGFPLIQATSTIMP